MSRSGQVGPGGRGNRQGEVADQPAVAGTSGLLPCSILWIGDVLSVSVGVWGRRDFFLYLDLDAGAEAHLVTRLWSYLLYGLNIRTPPKFMCWNLPPHVMVSGGDLVPDDGIGALIKGTREG